MEDELKRKEKQSLDCSVVLLKEGDESVYWKTAIPALGYLYWSANMEGRIDALQLLKKKAHTYNCDG